MRLTAQQSEGADQPQVPPARQRCPVAQVVLPQTHLPAEQVPALPALQDALPEQAHTPAAQAKLGGQAWPQAPQLWASVSRFLQPAGVWQHVPPAAHVAAPLQAHTFVLPDFTHVSPDLHRSPPHVHKPVSMSHAPTPPPMAQAPFELQPHWFAGRLPPLHTSPLA